MPIPDEERDRQFKRDVEKGLSITELSTKYQIGKRQVSRLKKKLKEEETPRRQVSKETATRQPVTTVAKKAKEEKMAFWLDKDLKEKLKILAVKQKRTASDIVREVLGRYLKNK